MTLGASQRMKGQTMSASIFKIRASEIMCRQTVTVSPTDLVHEALKLMEEHRVAALPVLDGQGRVVGMLSSTDLIELCRRMDNELHQLSGLSTLSREWLINKLAADGDGRQVREVMVSPVATVGPNTPLEIILDELLRNQIHRMPVVDGESRLVGLVSTTDVIRVLSKEAKKDAGSGSVVQQA